MGLFGGFCNFIKSGIERTKEIVKKVTNSIKETTKNIYERFTGKKKFDEAEKLYNEISQKYNSRRMKFESDVDKFCKSIESHVNAINNYKTRIKQDLLPQMAEKMKRICDVSVSENFNLEEFKVGNLTVDELRSKEKLYKIDFNKHPIKSNVLAVLTLGFYTRKKAKETLDAVQEQEGMVNTEIAKMDAKTKKLDATDKALSNVEDYFEGLTELYERLLVRLDSSVNFLVIRCMNLAHRIIKKEMSYNNLSKMQQKEISAIFKASAILKTMAETQIVSLENNEEVSKYKDTMKNQYDNMIKHSEAA